MKTILWATLVANGNFAQISAENPSHRAAFSDFLARAQATGNFIVGRKTFEELAASGESSMGKIDMVLVSQTIQEIPGVKVVPSPQEALAYLQARGYTTTLLAGGAALHNAFLGQGLVDELVLNVVPALEGKGLNLLLDQERYQYQEVRLLAVQSLGDDIVQLHYAVDHA
jgi:dihydrofolate reductase